MNSKTLFFDYVNSKISVETQSQYSAIIGLGHCSSEFIIKIYPITNLARKLITYFKIYKV